MTNDQTMTKLECQKEMSILLSDFGLRHSFEIRHSDFVIPIIPASSFRKPRSHFPFLIGARVGLLGADQTTAAKIEKRVVHQLHALFLSGLNYSREHEGLCFADHVGDCRSVCKYFERQHAPLAVGPRNELLTDDSAQRFADHDANLLLLTGRKDIE